MQQDVVHTLSEEPQSIPSVDWQQLRALSLQPGGFGKERAKIWPRILNVDASLYSDNTPDVDDEDTRVEDSSHDESEQPVEAHPDERQIQLDTDRSFVLYPVVPMKQREKQQQELYDLIVKVFRKRRRLSYFQGYHDIVSVLFLTLPPKLQLPCVEKLSLHRVRDSMGSSLEPVLGLLRVLQRILRLADPAYAELLEQNAPLPYFALSNLLTLFSHDIPTLPLIQHVFDYLLCRPPIYTVYLAAAFILARKGEVERLEEEGEEGMIHSLLSALPELLDGGDSPQSHPADSQLGGGDDHLDLKRTKPDRPTLKTTDDVLESDVEDTEASNGTVDSAVAEAVGLSEEEEHTLSDGSTVSCEVEDTLVEPSVNGEERNNDEDKGGEGEGEKVGCEKEVVCGVAESTLKHHLPPSPSEDEDGDNGMPEESKESNASHSSDTEEGDFTTTATEQTPSNSPIPPHPHSHSSRSISPDPLPPKPRITLSSLLERADELYTLYPPTHPAVNLAGVMGPQSVVFTWSEQQRDQRGEEEGEGEGDGDGDDEAELMVTQPHLIVLPPPPEEGVDSKVEDEEKPTGDEEHTTNNKRKRRRRRLRKPVRIGSVVVEQRTVVASAVLVLSVAMAVYGIQGAVSAGYTPESRSHYHMYGRELKRLGGYVGGLVGGFGGRFLGR